MLSVSRPSRLFVHKTRSIIRLINWQIVFVFLVRPFVRSFPGAAGRLPGRMLIDGRQQQQQRCYLQGAAYRCACVSKWVGGWVGGVPS